MSILHILVYLSIISSQTTASCPYVRQSIVLSDCILDGNVYESLGGTIHNLNSIRYVGYYSLDQQNLTDDHLKSSLIYSLGHRWMLLVPLSIKCPQHSADLTFTECQYTMKSSYRLSSRSEFMTTQLTVMNISNLGLRSVLFVQPGEITLRSCKAFNCDEKFVYITAPNDTFHFQIDYEKLIGSSCRDDGDCEDSSSNYSLLQCDAISRTCQCRDESMVNIEVNGVGRLCADSILQNNCQKFPQRCLNWCDRSKTSHCLCPALTRKVRKVNGLFDCELEPNSPCEFHDQHRIPSSVRKCPTGTFCDGLRCIVESSLFHQTSRISPSLNTSENLFHKATIKTDQRDQQTAAFIRTLIFIGVAIFLFFILILLIVIILITSDRCHLTIVSPEEKICSPSFAPSTSTGVSIDSSNQQQAITSISTIGSTDSVRPFETYLPRNEPLHGLVPQTSLSPRFHRQHQVLDERRRVPLQIRTPSLSRINPIVDHNSFAKDRSSQPKVTHMYNGDVMISV